MGEKIRDLKEIHIGDTTLMVELNEGYTKQQGRVIHVQNKHFRYLFNEKDFLHLCAEIMRSESELDYIKTHPLKKNRSLSTDNMIEFDTFSKTVEDISSLFRENSIDFRIIEEGNGYVTILIRPECRKAFRALAKNSDDFKVLEHPYGEKFGYTFLYQMNGFELYSFEDKYIEVYYQLPCMSSTPKTWIPLDSHIQKRIWTEKGDRLDPMSYYIFRLCWAIFKDEGFSNTTIEALDRYEDVLKKRDTKKYLEYVFFGFTGKMIKMLKEKRYGDIIQEYYSFTAY